MTPPGGEEKRFRRDLGIAYIQAYLDAKGVETTQYTSGLGPSIQEVVDAVIAREPRYLGIRCYDTNYYYAKLIARAVKRIDPKLRVVLGGPTATFSSDFIMKDCAEIDACVIHEGEETCHEMTLTDDWSTIAGLTVRSGGSGRGDGPVLHTGERDQIKSGPRRGELDLLPSPVLTGFMPPDDRVGLLTSRGCWYKCTYCNFSAMGNFTVRYHSPERIAAEVWKVSEAAREQGRERVYLEFYDDALTLNMRRAKEVFGKLIEQPTDNLDFFAHTRADSLDDDLLEMMKAAGVTSINFGLESGVAQILKTVMKARPSLKLANRPGTEPELKFLENVQKTIAKTKTYGIKPSVSIITGLPGESVAQARETLALIERLDVYEYTHNVLRVYAGTELADTYGDFDITVEDSPFGLPSVTHGNFDPRELEPLRHATVRNFDKRLVRSVTTLFTGAYAAGPVDGLAVLIDDWPNTTDAVSTFLAEFAMPCGSALYFSTPTDCGVSASNDDVVRRMQTSIQQLLVDNDVFTRDLNLMVESEDGWTWCSDLTGVDPLKRFTHHVTETSVGEFMSTLGERELGPMDISLLSVDTPEDVDAFFDLPAHEAYEALGAKSQESSIGFTDYCRWDCVQCPQLSQESAPQRLFLRGDGTAVMCASERAEPKGELLLRIGALRQDFAELKTQWATTQARRGCETCVARDSCSKCPNPSPVSEDEFCRRMRAMVESG